MSTFTVRDWMDTDLDLLSPHEYRRTAAEWMRQREASLKQAKVYTDLGVAVRDAEVDHPAAVDTIREEVARYASLANEMLDDAAWRGRLAAWARSEGR